ncbi:hypothetical protein L0U95_24255 (plasmid) [Burkholderia cenocepacia]|uniref:hypothetical protein n=1 Tax=Burkholderia cenocepacia TaxID=95486 RepID=UPI001F3D43E4|nr:hypothetical protein [Burkholderia cenocepacia]UJH75054.1 hypothetical protein L0U95_24255 [Burkholderia cenocepacia]
MNLFNFGGTNVNPLLNAMQGTPAGLFSGLNPMANVDAFSSAAGASAGPAAAPVGSAPGQNGLALMLSRIQGMGQQAQPPQQVPLSDYVTPQAPVSNPNLIPMNQLVGRLLARGGA